MFFACSRFFLLIVLVFFVTISLISKAQVKFPADPQTFAASLKTMLVNTKNKQAILTADGFDSSWESLSADQKKEFQAVCSTMLAKRFRVMPHFEAIVSGLGGAVGASQMSGARLSKLLNVWRQTVEKNTPAQAQSAIETTRQFLVYQRLFSGPQYTLLTDQVRSFDFNYISFSDTMPPPMATSDQQPVLSGPLLTFGSLDLYFKTSYDSSTAIRGTSGALMLATGTWVGDKGKLDWSLAGFGLEQVYAQLGLYNFAVKAPEFKAEKVSFFYPEKLQNSIIGNLEFKSRKPRTPALSAWPAFHSSESNIKIKNLNPNIEYEGGFSIEGTTVLGSSSLSETNYNTAKIRYNGVVVASIAAARIQLTDTSIYAPGARTFLYYSGDTLSHAGGEFFYNDGSKIIRFVKDKGTFKITPILDPYHKLQISCDQMRWRLDSSRIDFEILTAKFREPAVFESINYYEVAVLNASKGLFNFNPIMMSGQYVRDKKKMLFFVSDLAEYANVNPVALESAVNTLVAYGFLEYTDGTRKVRALPKLMHYYEAKKNKRDYDQLQILSISPPRENARLNTITKELTIFGVDRFFVSDSTKVFIVPENRQITILKDRNMRFDGKVSAGTFLANGRDFVFDYNRFDINLNKIDSITVMLDQKKTKGRVKNTGSLQAFDKSAGGDLKNNKQKNTSGVIYIAKPNNKSGLKQMPEYPIFDVVSEAYVYFDTKKILNGAYDKRIFFNVPPFKVDSAASNTTASINFAGSFNSDNIFPVFKEKLIVRPDKSLGFSHKTPDAGYALYKGDAKFIGTITLDNKGIRGRGEVRYKNAVVRSDDFIFYQDSVLAPKGKTFDMREGLAGKTDFPNAQGKDFGMRWLVSQDSMLLNSGSGRYFEMYNKKVDLKGILALTSTGAFGSGKLTTTGADIVSQNYTFVSDKIKGEHALFEIRSSNPIKPAVKSTDVHFLMDIKKAQAEIRPEVEGFASNEFPYTQYKTSIPKLLWLIDKKIVKMSKPEDVALSDSYFYSTLAAHDSLNFMADTALYDIEKYSLNIEGVPFIHVADSKIFPHKGRVNILENAQMNTLKNAKLLVDTIDGFHNLSQGQIQINSRHEFEGQATYLYVNSDNDTLKILFSNFTFEEPQGKKSRKSEVRQRTTLSGGVVEENKPLGIAPGILFKGNVTMYARKPNLFFDGQVKLNVKKMKNTDWINYKSDPESRTFSVDMKGATGSDGQPLVNGLYSEDGTGRIYNVFVGAKRNATDKETFAATGVLAYNPISKEFKVGNNDKIEGKSYQGNVFGYNDSLNTISYEGAFDLFTPLVTDRNFSLKITGNGRTNLDTNNYILHTLAYFQFDFPAKAWKEMGKTLSQRAIDLTLPEACEDKTALLYRLADLEGNRAAVKYNEVSVSGATPIFEVLTRLKQGLLLSDIDLHWSSKKNAWYSVGPIGLSSVTDKEINAKMPGYLEIKKLSDGGSVITLYLEASPDAWYYFKYDENKILAALSSSEDFNTVVSSKYKPGKAKPGTYTIMPEENSERNNFIKRFNKDYFNKVVNPSVAAPAPDKKPEAETEPADPFGEPDEKAQKEKEKKDKKEQQQQEKQAKQEEEVADPFADPIPVPTPTPVTADPKPDKEKPVTQPEEPKDKEKKEEKEEKEEKERKEKKDKEEKEKKEKEKKELAEKEKKKKEEEELVKKKKEEEEKKKKEEEDAGGF